MELINIKLMSKNNKQRGSYIYSPIVKIDGIYYRCYSIKSPTILRKEQVNLTELRISSCVKPEYYAANGLI